MSTPTSEPEVLDLAALTEDGFEALYAERLEPILSAHEETRRKHVSNFWFHMMLALPVGVIAACATYLLSKDGQATAFIGLSLAALTVGIAMLPIDQLRKTIKLELLESISTAIGVRYQTHCAERPGFDRCIALGLAPKHDRGTFEDFFHGEREGLAFDLYEGLLQIERSDRYGRKRYDRVFHGQIIQLAFPKAFQGVTVVTRDAGFFNAPPADCYKRVGLADPKFERLFEVYSNDQVEARALVHPVFMERLMEIERAFKGGKVRCGFEGGHLLVMIEGRDKFEPGSMFNPLTDPARARRVVEDIAQVLRLMDAVLTAELAPLVALRASRAHAAAYRAARSEALSQTFGRKTS